MPSEREFYATIVNRRYAPRPQARFFTRSSTTPRAVVRYVSSYFDSPEIVAGLRKCRSNSDSTDVFREIDSIDKYEPVIFSTVTHLKFVMAVASLLLKLKNFTSAWGDSRQGVFSDTFIVSRERKNYSNDGGLSERTSQNVVIGRHSWYRILERNESRKVARLV